MGRFSANSSHPGHLEDRKTILFGTQETDSITAGPLESPWVEETYPVKCFIPDFVGVAVGEITGFPGKEVSEDLGEMAVSHCQSPPGGHDLRPRMVHGNPLG